MARLARLRRAHVNDGRGDADGGGRVVGRGWSTRRWANRVDEGGLASTRSALTASVELPAAGWGRLLSHNWLYSGIGELSLGLWGWAVAEGEEPLLLHLALMRAACPSGSPQGLGEGERGWRLLTMRVYG